MSVAGAARRVLARQQLADGLLCLVVIGASLGPNFSHRENRELATGSSVLATALALGASLPIAVRRRYPLLVLAVVEAALALRLVLVDADPRAGGVGVAVAVYTVATRQPRPISLRAALGVGAVNSLIYLGMLAAGHLDSPGPADILFADVVVAGSWAIGDNVGTRRAYLASLEERAARLEREQKERAERAVLDERTRIARELHDVVAHHVSAIAVQAGAAEEIAEKDPGQARHVLGVIQATSRQALAEMRAIVGVLRESDDGTGLAPQPGLAQIDRLAAQTRAAGIDIRVRVDGTPRPLDEAVDLSAYRIVQEALTNTLKHAGASRVDVLVRYTESELELIVSDDGAGDHGQAQNSTGRGIVGMRERVALFHGRLDIGGPPGGGFRVHARLPTEPQQ